MKANQRLWYTQPAPSDEWVEALPVGNGKLGGMVFGGVQKEQIQLNEDTVWYGGPRDRNNPDALANLPIIQQHLLDGNLKEAERLTYFALSGIPHAERHYQPLGDLFINFEDQNGSPTNYTRELDIDQAVVTVQYKMNEIGYKREVFSSAVHQVMAIHLTAETEGKLSFMLDLNRHPYYDGTHVINEDTLMMRGQIGDGGVVFRSAVKVVPTGGKMYSLGRFLFVENADSATLYLSGRTDYHGDDPEAWCLEKVEKAAQEGYETVKKAHVAEYQSLYQRMDIELKGEDFSDLPTDQRLQRVKDGEEDLGLMSLYFQFGRYLLISSSRPGALPANLQGIWNKDMMPSWGSKYTININTEMNYWPTEVCNLSECHQPLFDHIERMRGPGRQTAKKMYGAKGFVAHHNTDLWGDTAPQDLYRPATQWPLGAAWLCLHLWDHYEFTEDLDFLKKAYETLKESAEFFVDFLTEDQQGRLVTNPSVSPENTYFLPNGERGNLCIGPSMDSQIIYALFTACIEATDLLGMDGEFGSLLAELRSRLPEPTIGKYGQIQEWAEDYEEAEPGHRHISHLFALHPANQITVRKTPELAEAAKVTLKKRLAHGGGHTGWSRAWIINMWARLEEAELAYENVVALLAKSTLPNLFDTHPPFQIDGNFGGTAGIAEMLLQSHEDEIHLLPALPKAWAQGMIKGICARGGFTLDFEWDQMKISEGVVCSKKGNTCRIRSSVPMMVKKDGESVTVAYEDNEEVIIFDTEPGKSYVLSPKK